MFVIIQWGEENDVTGVFGPFEDRTEANNNARTRLKEEVRAWKAMGLWDEEEGGHEECEGNDYFAILRGQECRASWAVFSVSGPNHAE